MVDGTGQAILCAFISIFANVSSFDVCHRVHGCVMTEAAPALFCRRRASQDIADAGRLRRPEVFEWLKLLEL